jgi:MFS family permease
MMLGYGGFAMFRLSLGVALPSIMQEFSITEAQGGWLVSTPLWSTAVFSAPAGYFADRFGHKKFLLYGYFLLALGVISIGFSRNYSECLIALAITGGGAGILIPSYFTLIGEALKRIRGLAIGVACSVYNIGGLLSAFLVGLSVAYQQWRLAYFIIGSTILLMTMAQYASLRHFVPQSRNDTELKVFTSFMKLMKTKNGSVAAIVALLSSIYFFTSVAWLPTFLLMSKNLDVQSISLVFGLFMVSGAISSPLLGALSDRMGRRTAISATAFATVAVSIPMFTTHYSFWLSIAYSFTLGFLAAPVFPLVITFIQESVEKELAASATGVIQTFSLLGAAAGPVIAGTLIIVIGIGQAILYTTVFSAIICGFLTLATVETRRR